MYTVNIGAYTIHVHAFEACAYVHVHVHVHVHVLLTRLTQRKEKMADVPVV